jgi:hypothetical protein
MGGVSSRETDKNIPNGDTTRNYREVETLIMCPMCLDKFTDPRMLKCQHTFCFDCLKNQVQAAEDSKLGDIICPAPNCKQWIVSTKALLSTSVDKWDSYFPKNITISKILEHLPDDEEYCDSHSDKLYEYFCETEKKLCCSTCVIEYHKKCDRICQVSEFTNNGNKFAAVCKNLLGELKKSRGQTNTMLNQLNNNVRKLEQTRDSIFQELEEFKREIIAVIETNQEAIKSEVDMILETKYEELEAVKKLEKKFTEYTEKLTNHKELKPLWKLKTLFIIDKFSAEEFQSMKTAQSKIKTIHIEFMVDKHKEMIVQKQLSNCVNHLLVVERPIY